MYVLCYFVIVTIVQHYNPSQAGYVCEQHVVRLSKVRKLKALEDIQLGAGEYNESSLLSHFR